MIYSKTCEYAIRALAFITQKGPKTSSTVGEVSRHTFVPKAYVAKIFQLLVRERILDSRRGPKGGFSLIGDPSKLTVLRIIQAVEDPSQSFMSGCVMGLNQCDDKAPCPLHFIWNDAKDKMFEKLSSCAMGDVAKIGGKFNSHRHQRFTLSKKMRGLFKT